ncbi:MAG: TraB/GumN family protein [Saprospiraceae bacterium]|nr:TraB/GumN family protein [Saprospiraceae bacterium]
MMRHIATLLSILFLQPILSGQEQGLLWKVEHPQTAKKAYVFGTIHLIPAKHFFLPSGLDSAFEQSSKIFMEIDMDDMENLGKIFGIMDKLFMEDGLSLEDLVNEQDYKLIETHFDNLGMPLSLLKRMKPLLLSALSGTEGNPMALKDGSFKSYEFELAEMSKQKNKSLEGLETLDFQISLFDSIPYTVQAKMLMESIQAPSDKMDELYNIYRAQDIGKMVHGIESEDPNLKPYLEMLIFKRNQSWVPIIEAEMQKGISLFAVGAGHLGGSKGLLQLLKHKGYMLTRVN